MSIYELRMHTLYISRSYRALCGVKNEFNIIRDPPPAVLRSNQHTDNISRDQPTAVLRSNQHTDKDSNIPFYFQRLVVDYKDILVGTENAMTVLDSAFSSLSKKFNGMKWWISCYSKKKRVVIMVSKESHCLYDLLIRKNTGELDCDIVLIISNHDKLQSVADMFGIPFRFVSCFACVCVPLHFFYKASNLLLPSFPCRHLPISPGGKRVQELQIEALLEEYDIDLVVLAKYMQIL